MKTISFNIFIPTTMLANDSRFGTNDDAIAALLRHIEIRDSSSIMLRQYALLTVLLLLRRHYGNNILREIGFFGPRHRAAIRTRARTTVHEQPTAGPFACAYLWEYRRRDDDDDGGGSRERWRACAASVCRTTAT